MWLSVMGGVPQERVEDARCILAGHGRAGKEEVLVVNVVRVEVEEPPQGPYCTHEEKSEALMEEKEFK
jgi:hypothetical protein